MAKDGYLPNMFGKVNGKYGTPGNAIAFCLLISLSGPVLGREALGWFVDMSAIGASMGFFFTSASALKRMFKDKDGNLFLKIMAFCGILFSLLFLILQLVPIPGLSGVHFGKESYLMLVVWIVLGFFFYLIRKTKKTVIIITHDLSEAISLADRIIVLGRRPAVVKKEIPINLTIKEDDLLGARNAPEFGNYFKMLWEEMTYENNP